MDEGGKLNCMHVCQVLKCLAQMYTSFTDICWWCCPANASNLKKIYSLEQIFALFHYCNVNCCCWSWCWQECCPWQIWPFTFCVCVCVCVCAIRVSGILRNSNESRSRCCFSSGCNSLSPGIPEKRSELVIHLSMRLHNLLITVSPSLCTYFSHSNFKNLQWQELLNVLSLSTGETILGLRENMTRAIGRLQEADSSVAVSSGGELFLRFITLTSLEHPVSISTLTSPSHHWNIQLALAPSHHWNIRT